MALHKALRTALICSDRSFVLPMITLQYHTVPNMIDGGPDPQCQYKRLKRRFSTSCVFLLEGFVDFLVTHISLLF